MDKEETKLMSLNMPVILKDEMEVYIAKLRLAGKRFNNSSFVVQLIRDELAQERKLKE